MSRLTDHAEPKLWRSLRTRKGRKTHGYFLAEGPRLVEAALEAGLHLRQIVHVEVTSLGEIGRALLDRAGSRGVPRVAVDAREFARYADTVTPQGILAVVRIPHRSWDEVREPPLLVLDHVSDPGNVGTLVRTAEAIGCGGVICLPGTAEIWSPKVVRAAAGSAFRIPVIAASWSETSRQIRARGWAIWVADPHAEPVYRMEAGPRELALVLGSEAHGVSGRIASEADRRISLPMAGAAESLNVGVAGAILMDRLFGV